MVVTWSDARVKLRGDLWRSAAVLTDDVCDRWLHTAIMELEGLKKFIWLENIETALTMTPQGDNLPAPADLSSVQSIAYLSSPDGYHVLNLVSLGRVRNRGRGTSTGVPDTYALAGNEGAYQFWFDCQIADLSEFELIYTARTPKDIAAAVTAGGTGNGNLTLNRELQAILTGAAHYVCQNFLRDEKNAQRHLLTWERHKRRIEDEEDEARDDETGGLVRADTAYRDAAFGRSRS